ncbi:heme ABC transporter substrate-binding protein IsdE [Ammoniphilus oxalaticus]|uniref:heme ABC transporter substrate-binding protein IsdE n=1 Tax=Ammoniphilus oxalaticus TaxID=66863 RepID=UPI003CCC7001
MKRKTLALSIPLLLGLMIGCSSEQPAAPTAVDGADEHRIVSTTVAFTEIMDVLELDLVGIPTSSKPLPPRYDGITEVGFVKNPDLEVIKWLKPTEVLSVSTLEYDLKPIFGSADINANFLNLDRVENMQQTIRTMGEKYDRPQQAADLAQKIDQKIGEIEKRIEGKEKPTVLILLGIPGSYLAATEHSYLGDLARLCGGINILAEQAVEYVAPNTEYLQEKNPDIILRAAHGMPEQVVEMFEQEFKENDIWKHFDAVKHDRVYDLEEEIFGTTGSLEVIKALDEMMNLLYP